MSDSTSFFRALGGSDARRCHELVQEYRAEADTNGAELIQLNAKETDLKSLKHEIQSLSMFSPSRYFVLHSCELWDWDKSLFEEVLKGLGPQCRVLAWASKIDGRSAMFKYFKKIDVLERHDVLTGRALELEIHRRISNSGLRFDEDAKFSLINGVGEDLWSLESALQQFHGRERVLLADVQVVFPDSAGVDAFALARTVAEGERESVMIGLMQLRDNREIPLQLLGALQWQLRQVVRVGERIQRRESFDAACRAERVHPGSKASVGRALKNFGVRAHRKRLARLALADVGIKGGAGRAWWWLERYLIDICPIRSARTS